VMAVVQVHNQKESEMEQYVRVPGDDSYLTVQEARELDEMLGY
jgi:hypothetical protein